MKILNKIIISLITVGLFSIVALSIYYYRNYEINLLQRNAKNKAIPSASSLENQVQKQVRYKSYRQLLSERLEQGDVAAAATIGPTKEVEDHILTTLQGDKWIEGAGMVHGLLYAYKWSPDTFSMKTRDALVDILERELKTWKPPYDVGQSGSDKDILTQDVCALYNPRAIPLLVKINMISCLSNYGEEGAGIVLSTSASLAKEVASTKLEAYKLSDKKGEVIDAIGGFTKSPTSWNSLNPDIQNKLKTIVYNDLKDKDWGLRLWAIKALAPIADKQDVNTLKAIYYKDPNKGRGSVREEAEKALTERAFLWNSLDKGTQESIRDNIYQKLKNKDWIMRWNAIKELAPIANKNDIPILEKLSKDPVSYVSEIANKTLEELKAKDTSH